MKKLIAAALLSVFYINVFCQDALVKVDTVFVKDTVIVEKKLVIGFVDREKIFNLMPEKQTVDAKITQLKHSYEDEYQLMSNDYNSKVKFYLENNKTMSEPIRQARQTEITETEKRIDLFKQKYLQFIEQQQNNDIKPVNEKLDLAIKQAAKEAGCSIVFDSKTPLFVDENCVDLFEIVRKNLEIK